MSSWARIIVFAVSINLLAFSFAAKAGQQDEDSYGDQAETPYKDHAGTTCDDRIADYQKAVNACLNNAKDLDEARDCWSAQSGQP